MIYSEWMKQLDRITYEELGLETADLPDVPTRDAYDDGLTPEEAFEIFVSDYWQEYDPEADQPREYYEIESYTDADPGL
jgi:hypothetical protein